MAKKLRIPRLEPYGTRAAVRTHARSRERAGRRSDQERLAGEPWRASAYGSRYRRNRQLVIERAQGRCEDCGRVCAVKERGTWKSKGGQVHHEKALCDGGGDDPANLAFLCPSCHGLRDAKRRREASGG